jgi:hypothetical protein
MGLAIYKQFHPPLVVDRNRKTNTLRLQCLVIQDAESPYKFEVTCDETRKKCGSGYVASMDDASKNMNFCLKFFNPDKGENKKVVGTLDQIASCATVDIRLAGRTRAAVILHELTHTKYVLGNLGNDERFVLHRDGQ